MSMLAWLKSLFPSQWRRDAMIRRVERDLLGAPVIRDGPFRGMKYISHSVGAPLMPKFLGTYELELGAVLNLVFQLPLKTIVEVGAGEGYYAVGLALKQPQAKVIAFEEDHTGIEAIRTVAELNGVADRIDLLGRCELGDLAAVTSCPEGGFLMMDVEGYEAELLKPELLPNLESWHILFEAHDLFLPGVGQRVSDRFQNTHDILKIDSRPRSLSDIHCLSWFEKRYAIKFCFEEWTMERLAAQSWYYLTPKRKL